MIKTQSLPEKFKSTVSNGAHEIHTDAPVSKGGEGAGFGAHDLLEAAFATCINMAVRMYAERVVFTYALELAGPFSSDQRRQLEHVADACPVRQTLSKRLEFEAIP